MAEPRGSARRQPEPGSLEAGRRLRLARLAVGLSQSQLAQSCGISRQAIAGAEAGVWSPSLAVALQLARALGTTVEQIFTTESTGPSVVAASLLPGGSEGRARIARVWDRWVAMPLTGDRAMVPGFIPASGLLDARRSSAQLWGTGRSLLVAGCDPALPLLAGPVSAAGDGWSLEWWPCGSGEARRLLRAGLVHAAAIHYPANRRARQIPPPTASSMGFASWREGMVLRPGQSPSVRTFEKALELRLRWVNREQGAQARRLLDEQLEQLGVGGDVVSGYASAAAGHLQVASAVSSRAADVGMATEPSALAYGLDFVPLSEEECVLLVDRDRLQTPEMRQLLAVLAGPQLRRELDALPGYDAAIAGTEL